MKSINDYEKELDDNPKGFMKKVLLWIISLMILFGLVSFIFTPFLTVKDVVQETLKSDNVLSNYEWFKQQNQDWIAIKNKITQSEKSVSDFKELAGQRSDWTFEDKTEYSRLSVILDGFKYQKEDIESKYNARSEMLNRNLFKTNDLPHILK